MDAPSPSGCRQHAAEVPMAQAWWQRENLGLQQVRNSSQLNCSIRSILKEDCRTEEVDGQPVRTCERYMQRFRDCPGGGGPPPPPTQHTDIPSATNHFPELHALWEASRRTPTGRLTITDRPWSWSRAGSAAWTRRRRQSRTSKGTARVARCCRQTWPRSSRSSTTSQRSCRTGWVRCPALLWLCTGRRVVPRLRLRLSGARAADVRWMCLQ